MPDRRDEKKAIRGHSARYFVEVNSLSSEVSRREQAINSREMKIKKFSVSL